MKKFFIPVLAFLMFSCTKDVLIPDANNLTEYSFDKDSNSSLMYKDGESPALLHAESRIYEIGKVLRVKAINATTIEVANFAPVDIEGATILLTIQGQDKAVKLFKIAKIRAHGVQEIKYPFIAGNTKFLNTANEEVDLAAYKEIGLETNKVSFDFTGESELIKKLKSLSKLKWKIKYNDFDPNDNTKDNWKENMSAKDVRRYSGFMINLAYMLQDARTRAGVIAEPITNNNQVQMTSEQKESAYNSMLNIPRFNSGVVVNVSGLGGGATFGVADHILKDYLSHDICYISVHEVAHMIGYSHNSSMTYPSNNRGAVVATGVVYREMLKNDEFPIKKANYYMPADL